MNTLTNIGVIECGHSAPSFQLDPVSRRNGFHLKKVAAMEDNQSITDDGSIHLVVISGYTNNDLGLVSEILQSGKHVRIMDGEIPQPKHLL